MPGGGVIRSKKVFEASKDPTFRLIRSEAPLILLGLLDRSLDCVNITVFILIDIVIH